MRIYDLIAKKRDGGTHTREELEAIVNGFVSGEVADYQMAAWMMAVYLRGMTNEETAELTDVMAHSGVMVDLSPIPGIKVDKHSTGGVGDKTTLVIAPIVAACGVKIAKMSGRGLGHTGGTIDKMESVPGTKTALSQEEFFAQVNRIGLSVIGQSEGIAVADKKMYALRDVTATVSCIPLIASSIMSKKLASGSDAILLDVTTGTGAFMKTVDQSIELAQLMVAIGTHHGRRVAAMITDMDTPLPLKSARKCLPRRAAISGYWTITACLLSPPPATNCWPSRTATLWPTMPKRSALPVCCWAQAARKRATRWTFPPALPCTKSAATMSIRAKALPPSTAQRTSLKPPPPSTAAALCTARKSRRKPRWCTLLSPRTA